MLNPAFTMEQWYLIGMILTLWLTVCMLLIGIWIYVDKHYKKDSNTEYTIKDVLMMIVFFPLTIIVLIILLIVKILEWTKLLWLGDKIGEFLNKPVKRYKD